MNASACVGWARCRRTIVALGVLAASLVGLAHANDLRLLLSSKTFVDGGTLPLSMINTFPGANGQNTCTANGAAGGNQSPELSWTHAPAETQSFVVVVYDVTAAFTHWGMYNISAGTTHLPVNAGVAASSFGEQIANDFGDLSYDGPCPPMTLKPFAHHYKFTVYALDALLQLPSHGDFSAGAESLYHALIGAGRHGHILASASISGFYSSVAPAN